MKMKQTKCSETSAYKLQTPGNYPKESIQHTEHGESLKSRIHIWKIKHIKLFFHKMSADVTKFGCSCVELVHKMRSLKMGTFVQWFISGGCRVNGNQRGWISFLNNLCFSNFDLWVGGCGGAGWNLSPWVCTSFAVRIAWNKYSVGKM